VITSYQEIMRWLGGAAPTTRRLREDIRAAEEEHADDLIGLLAT
jgi:bacterioferritin